MKIANCRKICASYFFVQNNTVHIQWLYMDVNIVFLKVQKNPCQNYNSDYLGGNGVDGRDKGWKPGLGGRLKETWALSIIH